VSWQSHRLMLPFPPGNCLPKATTVGPHPPYFSLFPEFKINLKGCHFDTFRWSVQNGRWCWTPSQNTTSRMHLNKKAVALGMMNTCGRGLLRGWWWPVVPKLIFWPYGSTRSRYYGWHMTERIVVSITGGLNWRMTSERSNILFIYYLLNQK
jgi:hypothetical protein